MVRGRYVHILGPKVKFTTELCHCFCSYTISWAFFNVELSYFIHRCRMVRGRYLYILRSIVKVTTELCQYFGFDTITWVVFNVQLLYFIHRSKIVRGRYLYIFRSKGQCHNGTLSLLWFWHDNLSSFSTYNYHISYIDLKRKLPIHFEVQGSKVKVTTERCRLFGSDPITRVVFNIQLSYFIHRCRMVRGKYLYILRSKCQRLRS